MLYLDYTKPVEGGYVLNFFADKVEDMGSITGGTASLSDGTSVPITVTVAEA